jgi:hypothetical protein
VGRTALTLRERMGREASPSAAVLDSPSVKSAEKGAAEGERPQNPRPGRYRGTPMRVFVRSAAIQDRDGAGLVLDKIRGRFPWIELIWADGGHNA